MVGEESFYHSLVVKFVTENLLEALTMIRDTIVKRQWDLVRRYTHSLKGSSGYVAAEYTCEL